MPSRSRHMSPYPDLNNRVALVTGASRGIGAAIATALADAGAAVAVNYRERAAEADKVTGAIRQRGRPAMAVEADVSQSTAVSRMIERVTAELGPIDILINNAGVGLNPTIDTVTEADFDLTIAVNLKSAFLCTQAVLPGMRARKWAASSISRLARRAVRALSACTTMLRKRDWRD
jgi:3-oxoacyl-[acyl-carrier protein] reductase